MTATRALHCARKETLASPFCLKVALGRKHGLVTCLRVELQMVVTLGRQTAALYVVLSGPCDSSAAWYREIHTDSHCEDEPRGSACLASDFHSMLLGFNRVHLVLSS